MWVRLELNIPGLMLLESDQNNGLESHSLPRIPVVDPIGQGQNSEAAGKGPAAAVVVLPGRAHFFVSDVVALNK
jgi:hypothetical protein